MDSTALNTVLMVLVIPAVAGLWRTMIAVNRTLSTLATAITGAEGQGGALFGDPADAKAAAHA